MGRLAYALIITMLTACSSDSVGPTGTLQVSVDLTGNSSDEDGVTIRVVPQEGSPIVSNVATTAGNVALEVSPGSYDVSVGDVADNCWTDSQEMSVTVSDGVPTPVTFEITCRVDRGSNRLVARWRLLHLHGRAGGPDGTAPRQPPRPPAQATCSPRGLAEVSSGD